jgi:hypothetical protein
VSLPLPLIAARNPNMDPNTQLKNVAPECEIQTRTQIENSKTDRITKPNKVPNASSKRITTQIPEVAPNENSQKDIEHKILKLTWTQSIQTRPKHSIPRKQNKQVLIVSGAQSSSQDANMTSSSFKPQ